MPDVQNLTTWIRWMRFSFPKPKRSFGNELVPNWNQCSWSARFRQKTHPEAALGIEYHCRDLSAHVSKGYEIWCYFMNMHDVSLLCYPPLLLSIGSWWHTCNGSVIELHWKLETKLNKNCLFIDNCSRKSNTAWI